MVPQASLAQRIRRYRRGLGLNQTQFGQRFGVNRITISGWENGSTTPSGKRLPGIIAELDAAEAEATQQSGHQFILPFDQHFDLSVRMSPQGTDTIHLELKLHTKAG